jgi:hypothetical protein
MTAPGDDAWADPGLEIDVELTGHSHVDLVLDRLSGIDDQPLTAHAEVFDSVHQRLRGILTEPGDR